MQRKGGKAKREQGTIFTPETEICTLIHTSGPNAKQHELDVDKKATDKIFGMSLSSYFHKKYDINLSRPRLRCVQT